jgi:hypothetical protein
VPDGHEGEPEPAQDLDEDPDADELVKNPPVAARTAPALNTVRKSSSRTAYRSALDTRRSISSADAAAPARTSRRA